MNLALHCKNLKMAVLPFSVQSSGVNHTTTHIGNTSDRHEWFHEGNFRNASTHLQLFAPIRSGRQICAWSELCHFHNQNAVSTTRHTQHPGSRRKCMVTLCSAALHSNHKLSGGKWVDEAMPTAKFGLQDNLGEQTVAEWWTVKGVILCDASGLCFVGYREDTELHQARWSSWNEWRRRLINMWLHYI